MNHFHGKLFLIGYGAVARCFLPLLLKHIPISPTRITILEPRDMRYFVNDLLAQGLRYLQGRITLENYQTILLKETQAGDMVMDLAWGVGSYDIAMFCHQRDVFYLGSSLERWDGDYGKTSLYEEQSALIKNIEKNQHRGTTAVFQHGANPGLISHFVKSGLTDIALQMLADKQNTIEIHDLEKYLADDDFSKLSQALRVKVVHVSERDTQYVPHQAMQDMVLNTWSVEAFAEEMSALGEVSVGTHEDHLPSRCQRFSAEPHAQVYFQQPAYHVRMKSWTPSGPMVGMVVRHDETFTIAEHLTIHAENEIHYRPTVCFVYRPIETWMERFKNDVLLPDYPRHIISHEIASGADEMGALIMGHPLKAWWTGSILSIEDTRKCVPNYNNSTVLQVACSMLAAFIWILKNPKRGLNIPEHLPHREILAMAKPYLGTYYSQAVDWCPVENKPHTWQMSHFLSE